MHDQALHLLFNQLQRLPAEAHCLWFADENSHEILPLLAARKANLTVATNRYDIHQLALTQGLKSTFNDVIFDNISEQLFDAVFIRISKEKSVTHRAINQALTVLTNDGKLILAGYKNEGIKTYNQKSAAFFSEQSDSIKLKDAHTVTFSKKILSGSEPALDDNNYSSIRAIGSFQEFSLLSKPGVFGFEKIDSGTRLLIEQADRYLTEQGFTPQSVLDLGCGYGLLAMTATTWGVKFICATDNNAAALAAVKANANHHNLNIEVIASDAGEQINEKFDVVLCNPPFHQGFTISGDLTDKFLKNASQKLIKNGIAFFVVNSFIGLEKKAGALFSKQQLLINNKQFKVVALVK